MDEEYYLIGTYYYMFSSHRFAFKDTWANEMDGIGITVSAALQALRKLDMLCRSRDWRDATRDVQVF